MKIASRRHVATLGVINISKYGIGWGFSSSPAVHDGRIVVVCHDPENPFLAAHPRSDGKEIWRTSRTGICERSWGTPLIHSDSKVSQVVVNGWPWIAVWARPQVTRIWIRRTSVPLIGGREKLKHFFSLPAAIKADAPAISLLPLGQAR